MVSSAVLVNLVSTFFSSDNPEFALSINPLNQNARNQLLYGELVLNQNELQVEEAQLLAQEGVDLEPYSGVSYSLLGIAMQKENNVEQSQELFVHALKLAPTEIQALLRRLDNLNSNENAEEIFQLMERAIRRWPRFSRGLSPFYQKQLKDDIIYDLFFNRFMSLSPLDQSIFIRQVFVSKGDPAILVKLTQDLHAAGVFQERARRIAANRLIEEKRLLEAYEFFKSTLTPQEVAVDGIIFDSEFKLSKYNEYYEWRLPRAKGLHAEFIDNTDKQESMSGIRLKFLGTPLRLNSTLQIIKLPPSILNLSVSYQSRNLVAPKPLRLKLICSKGKLSEEIPLEKTSGELVVKSLQIDNSDSGCEFVSLKLISQFLANTWNNRYEGQMLINKVSIELAEGT